MMITYLKKITLYVCLFIIIPFIPGSAQAPNQPDLYDQLAFYLQDLAMKQLSVREQKIKEIKTIDAAKSRQKEVKETILELIGGLPERTPLNAQVVDILERDGYRIEKVVYESQPNFHVSANLYLPTTGSPLYPGVLSPCGHSYNGKAARAYQSVYISLAKKGFVVLAYDPIGQGERYQYFHPWYNRSLVGRSTLEHTVGAIQALPIGLNIARFRIWDGIRSLDYLISRPEVDETRIGVTGNSGGGTLSAYLTALDERISVSVPSCYITSWRQLFTNPGPQDGEQNFVFGIESSLDHADFIEAFAPKPLQICAAIQDFFPIDGTRATYKEAKKFYEIFKTQDKLALFEADDKHGFTLPRREATYRWLGKWLQGKGSDEGEPTHIHENDWDLLCTKTGQVLTSFENEETVATFLAREKEYLKYQHTLPKSALDYNQFVARMKPIIKQRIRLNEKCQPSKVTRFEESILNEVKCQKILLNTEPRIDVPLTLFMPKQPKDFLLLYLNDAGREADLRENGDINELIEAGFIVCAVDPRGVGASAPPKRSRSSGVDFVGPHWKIAMQALLVGKTLLGMQVYDILSVIDYLKQQPEFENLKIKCITKGLIGMAALHAAALDQRLNELILEKSLLSYNAVARNPISQSVFMAIIPGALRDYDLPTLATMIAPRKISLTNTIDQMQNFVNPALVAREYDFAVAVYKRLGGAQNFKIKYRPSRTNFFDIYPDWR